MLTSSLAAKALPAAAVASASRNAGAGDAVCAATCATSSVSYGAAGDVAIRDVRGIGRNAAAGSAIAATAADRAAHDVCHGIAVGSSAGAA